jgi:hypothetical protein
MEEGWEYLCVDIPDCGAGAEKRTEMLNEYAEQGWELVNGSTWWLYFKKPRWIDPDTGERLDKPLRMIANRNL